MPQLVGKSSAEINRFVVGKLNKFVAAILTPIRMKVEQAGVTTEAITSLLPTRQNQEVCNLIGVK
jgi:hypothetical protein